MSKFCCPKCKKFELKFADSDEMYVCDNCYYWWYLDELEPK